MPKQYTQEQIEQILEKLPAELRETMFSLETADTMGEICHKYGVTDENAREVVKYTGYVLMGLMLPAEFSQILEKEIKVPKKVVEELAREINRFVFYPVKPALEQLHRMEIEISAKIVTPKPEQGRDGKEKPEEPKREDDYREPIE